MSYSEGQKQPVVKSILETLPWRDVLFRNVFPYLGIWDLFRMREVSSSFYVMMEEYFAQWEEISISAEDGDVTARALEIMTRNNTALRTLVVHNAKDWMVDDILIPIISDCPALQVLDLTECKKLTNRSLCMMGMYCNNLTRVWLRGCNWMDQDNFMVFVSGNPHLILLDVSECVTLDDACIEFLVNSCKNISFLSLCDVRLLTDRSFYTIAKAYRDLQLLEISDCRRVTDFGISVVGEYCRKLRILNCSYCPGVSEKSLAKLRSRGVAVDVEPPADSVIMLLENPIDYNQAQLAPRIHLNV